MSNRRIEDIENHMIIEEKLYGSRDGFVRDTDFLFEDDDFLDDIEDFDVTQEYDKDAEGNLVLHVDPQDITFLDALKYRGTKPDIDGEVVKDE